MPRSVAEFADGGSITAYHVSAKSNRASIERNGLIPGEPWNGKINRVGVFGALRAKDVGKHALYADDRPYGETEGPHAGGDIWEFNVPAGNVVNDTWTMPRNTAVRHPTSIPATNLKRVGHVTGDNEVHWHTEENCDGR